MMKQCYGEEMVHTTPKLYMLMMFHREGEDVICRQMAQMRVSDKIRDIVLESTVSASMGGGVR